jgi:predicted NAD/FAD-dependent oxidoreductase
VDRWIDDGLVYRWSTGWSDGSLASAAADGHARYAVQGGMNALAKHLAQGLDTRVNVRLVGVSPDCGGWRSEDKGGRMYVSQALLLTPPVPQSLALLDAGGVKLEQEDRGILEYIEYAPCLAGLFQIDGSVNLPEPGALQRPEAAISWISDNRRKGISPDDTIITVHAGPDYSRRLFARPEAETLAELEAGLRPFLDQQTVIVEAQLKRWRYALPRVFHSGRCLVATGLPTLVFAGDAFGGPRIEGAALSGLFAGKVIGERFSIPSGL